MKNHNRRDIMGDSEKGFMHYMDQGRHWTTNANDAIVYGGGLLFRPTVEFTLTGGAAAGVVGGAMKAVDHFTRLEISTPIIAGVSGVVGVLFGGACALVAEIAWHTIGGRSATRDSRSCRRVERMFEKYVATTDDDSGKAKRDKIEEVLRAGYSSKEISGDLIVEWNSEWYTADQERKAKEQQKPTVEPVANA
jgi:hypothetical protein